MLNLFLSILFTIGIVVTFRYAHKVKVNILQVLTANYLTCVVLGNIVYHDLSYLDHFWNHDWFLPTVLLGSFFIFSFYVFGYSTLVNGITPTIISNKLSLIIPVTAGFLVFGDTNSYLKSAGIILAVVSVILASIQKTKKAADVPKHNFLIILSVFLASGIVDFGLKYMEFHFYDSPHFSATPIFLYGCSFVIGSIALFIQLVWKKTKIHFKSIGMGILLGITNYTSLWFFFKAIHQPGYDITWVLPVTNIMVMLASIASARFMFKEKIVKTNFIGMFLAIIALGLLLFSAYSAKS